MSASAKALFYLFVLFALAAVGNDIYIWQTSPGYPFNFAALGWITKNYLPNEHQMVVDSLGAETFNSILTPILKIPAFFLSVGLAALTYGIDFLNRMIRNAGVSRGKDRDMKFKRK